MPDSVDLTEAAAVTLQGLAAYYLTHETYPVAEGETVVVLAAAGGLGRLLLQLAAARGATVVAIASTPEKEAVARRAGAHHTFGYDKFDDAVREVTDGQGARLVYDSVGATTHLTSLRSLGRRGTLALCGLSSGPVPPLDIELLRGGGSLFLTRPTMKDYVYDASTLRAAGGAVFGHLASGVLDLPGNAPDAVHRVRTKDEARAHLTAAGFLQPAFRVCVDEKEARDFLATSTGPWVVKPRDAMGSEGVTRIESATELAAALEFLPGNDTEGVSFIVEEFVEGPEYSAEGVFIDGAPHVLALTSKELLPPPNFFEIEYVIPAILPDETAAEIEKQVVAALTALELRFGQFHVELWWTERGVVLGEVHVRNAGGWIHRMLPHVIPGLEWFGLVYDDVLGRPVDKAALKPVRGSAIRFLTPPPGRLTAIEGWDEVLAHPALIHAELAIAPRRGRRRAPLGVEPRRTHRGRRGHP
ncbi:zinc-binding dehydrogenase [Streptomyces turgidiscabies]|uniref:zinc-binding dehydrogenase n=1 Tax=Streptomyces turgidiscabies TaxID=85558 RepID=UPI0027D86B61|nr:zinc-binding dehydrogenase [Streptomyces turgidiscabies]